MPNSNTIVINTSPLIALVAAWGDLSLLSSLYQDVFVPLEVSQEMMKGGTRNFAVREFLQATWLKKQTSPLTILPFLLNSLDLGEASVIQFALNHKINKIIGRSPHL